MNVLYCVTIFASLQVTGKKIQIWHDNIMLSSSHYDNSSHFSNGSSFWPVARWTKFGPATWKWRILWFSYDCYCPQLVSIAKQEQKINKTVTMRTTQINFRQNAGSLLPGCLTFTLNYTTTEHRSISNTGVKENSAYIGMVSFQVQKGSAGLEA